MLHDIGVTSDQLKGPCTRFEVEHMLYNLDNLGHFFESKFLTETKLRLRLGQKFREI